MQCKQYNRAAFLLGIALEQKLEAKGLKRNTVTHEVFRHGFDLLVVSECRMLESINRELTQ